jgi:UDP-glucose 4-epimerase
LKRLEAGKESAALNLGTGVGCSVQEVIAVVEEVTGRKVPRKTGPRRAGDPSALVADPARAQAMLNWKARRSLREIVETAWQWEQGGRRKALDKK